MLSVTLNLSSVNQFTDVQITVLIAVSELGNVACGMWHVVLVNVSIYHLHLTDCLLTYLV